MAFQNTPDTFEALLGVNKPKQGPSFVEQTRGQVSIWGNTVRNEGYGLRTPFLAALLRDTQTGTTAWYRKIREMRKHPTVGLVRSLSVAVMAGSPWSVKAEDNAIGDSKDFISRQMLPMQDLIMGTSLRGTFDFGWQPFEKVFQFNVETMQIELGKLKPLLQDQTDIVVRTNTGQFAGFKQFMTFMDLSNVLLVNFNVEGTYYYGEGNMPSIEQAVNRWWVTDDSNVRFDKKVSGSHWVVHYPVGNTPINGGTANIDNFKLANAMLSALEGSGSIVVPNDLQQMVTDLNGHSTDTSWKIELLTADSSAQVGFQARLSYLDSLIVRAGGFPERSILEGQYGTKAEAEAHADFAVALMDYRNKQIINQVNWHLVNQLLVLNYGPKAANTVKIEVAPIADDKIAMIKQVYMAALANPAVGPAEFGNIDMPAMRDQVGLPSAEHPVNGGACGPDYTGGTGVNGGHDPMLQQFLANLNTAPEAPIGGQPDMAYQQSALAASL